MTDHAAGDAAVVDAPGSDAARAALAIGLPAWRIRRGARPSLRSRARATGRVAATTALAALLAVGIPGLTVAAAPTMGILAPNSIGGSSMVGGFTLAGGGQPADVHLFRADAMVAQFTLTWCVPANTQSMLNLIFGTADRSRATQRALYDEIRASNLYTYATAGNDVHGWATALNRRLGPGAYGVRMFSTRGAAIEGIVDSLERTGRPVGVVVDAGTHAWTVVGYRATEWRGTDGAITRRVVDGLYVWGSLGPGTGDPWPFGYQTVGQFAKRFTLYHEWQKPVIWEDQYVFVGG
jgi:hypothetical protein